MTGKPESKMLLPMAVSPPRPVGSDQPVKDPEQVKTIVLKWVSCLTELAGEIRARKNDSAFTATELRPRIQQLFHENGYWRDLVCLSWDFHTLSGVDKITTFLTEHPDRLSRLQNIALDDSSPVRVPRSFPIDPEGPVMGIQSCLTIGLDIGAEAAGVLRLGRDDDGAWKAWTFATVLQRIKGHEVKAGLERPLHLEYGYELGRKNFGAQRALDASMEDEGPTVLIVGMLILTRLSLLCSGVFAHSDLSSKLITSHIARRGTMRPRGSRTSNAHGYQNAAN
jgi:hypothetical protein